MQPEQCLQILVNAVRLAQLTYYKNDECDNAIQELDKFIKQKTEIKSETPVDITDGK